MYLFDLQAKLRELHPDLYVKTDTINKLHCGLVSSGIYLKNPKRAADRSTWGKHYVHEKQRKYLEAIEAGQLDKFIMGVCLNYIPEYDIYDLERERILMPGWRTIVKRLHANKIITLDKARKVFNCKSLGESDWDKLNLHQRIRLVKGVQ